VNASAVARRMALCCRQLAAQGLIAGRDGNLSVRLGADRVLVTPSGFIKSLLEPADMVEVDLAGRPRKRGTRKPRSEVALPLRILRHRPDVHAVVHAHPPAATGFAVAGEEFMAPVLPELILQMGGVPLVPYVTPGGDALADGFETFLPHHDAFLMANHGATTIGPSLTIA